MRYVYVLDVDGKPLMPTCRYGKVRRMLKSGQAKVVSTVPFTIRLTYQPEMRALQPVTIGIDPGRTNIGLAAVRADGTDLYRAHCETRNKEIPKLMADRRAHRQASRRGERLARKRLAKKLGTTAKHLLERILPGCEKPLAVKDIINTEARFNNRMRPEEWLTPTATQLLRTHVNLIRKICKILPVTDVALEINRFAFMELADPEHRPHGVDFQHGALYGTGGLKNAVREQQNGRCLLCGEREIEHFHHTVPRSRRGGNTVAKNRRKRMDQKTDSLQDWFEKMVQKYGIREAEHLRSRLTVKKSTRHYNNRNRVMPGTVFRFKDRRYVMSGQISGGLYYRAYGCGGQNFSSRKVRIIRQNEGLVYTA